MNFLVKKKIRNNQFYFWLDIKEVQFSVRRLIITYYSYTRIFPFSLIIKLIKSINELYLIRENKLIYYFLIN